MPNAVAPGSDGRGHGSAKIMLERLRMHSPFLRSGPVPQLGKPSSPTPTPAAAKRPTPRIFGPDTWVASLRSMSADPFGVSDKAYAPDITSNPEAWLLSDDLASSTSPTLVTYRNIIGSPTSLPFDAPPCCAFESSIRTMVEAHCSAPRAFLLGRPRSFLVASLLQRHYWPTTGLSHESHDSHESIEEQQLRFWCALDLLPAVLEAVALWAQGLTDAERRLAGRAALDMLKLPSVDEWQTLFPAPTDDAHPVMAAMPFIDRAPSADLLASVLLAGQTMLGGAQLTVIARWVETWKAHVPHDDPQALEALRYVESGRARLQPPAPVYWSQRLHRNVRLFPD